MSAARSPIRIQFAHERRTGGVEDHPRVLVVGAVPAHSPWVGDRAPAAVVRAGRLQHQACAFEHLRLSGSSRLDLLPTLQADAPSLVSDAVATVLRAGSAEVDLVLWRAAGSAQADLLHPAITEQLPSFLGDQRGAILLFPDLKRASAAAIHRLVALLAQQLAESCQLACIDAPDREADRLVSRLTGADIALVRWRGDDDALIGHQWRSAAAVVGGLLGTDHGQGRSLTHRRAPLRPPRAGALDRRAALTPHRRIDHPPVAPLEDEGLVDLLIDPVDNVAVVQAEPSLRRPRGDWPLPALLTVKQVHRRVAEAADRFVFRTVTTQEALNLTSGLHIALRPFLERGLLVGERGVGAPQIEGAVLRDPSAPGLGATITGYLRPWMQKVSMRVMVRAGEKPTLLEA